MENKIQVLNVTQAKENGFKTFKNTSEQTHVCIDLSENTSWDSQITISLKLPFGDEMTITPTCLLGSMNNVEITVNNDENKMKGWKDGQAQTIEGGVKHYTVIYQM